MLYREGCLAICYFFIFKDITTSAFMVQLITIKASTSVRAMYGKKYFVQNLNTT